MLSRLEINDFALIENASLEFREGFTVMTGETGAGKSILIDAIGAVCGERTNRDIVRTGKEVASVTAVFDDPDKISVNLLLSESGIILEDDSLIVTREIMSSGKTLARINGRIVPISLLRKIMSQYIDIHGQNENQSLFIQDTQLLLLDRYGQRSIESIKDDYNSKLNNYRKVCAELKAFITEPGQKEKVVDLLKYQIREIRDADIKPEEDIKLLEQRKILANAEKIRTVLEFVIQVLNGEDDLTAIPAVKEASLRISSHLSGFEEFNSLSESLNDIACSLEDVNAEVLMALDRIDADPVKLSTLDKRIDLIEDLKHKYGGSIESVLLYFDKAVKQLSEIINSEDKVKELTDKRNHLSKELSSLSAE
ncbi:DNA repair protein RecN, partial [Candidatus Nomurabacteria bacterium]|nr:DNA repair protein RecN [Candidatus Nomurabacteria bacterium]